MGEIAVLLPGLYSSIQDMGRLNFRKFGVPLSGVMDSYAAKMSNLILGNSEEQPVLEFTQLGPKLKFSESTEIAICGAFLSPKINEQVVSNNKLLSIKKGDVLSFGKRIIGCRAYLSIAGGFNSEIALGSASWYHGITESGLLQKGNVLKYSIYKKSSHILNASIKVETDYITNVNVKVFKGPEYEMLTTSQRKVLLESGYTIDNNNNRMAIQLKEALGNELQPIITGPVLPGTVQLTPSGKLIVLMRDCQTTGGYPRILQLSEGGMNTIAQKVVGETVMFQLVEIN